MEDLLSLVTLLVALSVASERLVEIVKGFISTVLPWLSEKQENPKQESLRRAVLQLMAVGAGMITALLAQPALVHAVPEGWGVNPLLGTVALGLLASGGSGFWNAILAYLLQVKDLKKIEVEANQRKVDAARPGPAVG